MLLLKGLNLCLVCTDPGLDLFPIRMVIGQACMHLRQAQMPEFIHDLFWTESHLVQEDDALNRHACACNPRAIATNIGRGNDHFPDVYSQLIRSWQCHSRFPLAIVVAHSCQPAYTDRPGSIHMPYRVPWYHSIVRRSPTSNGVVASNPNSAFARLVSSFRLGWPLGFVVSQTIRVQLLLSPQNYYNYLGAM